MERKVRMELTNDMDFKRERDFYFKALPHKNFSFYEGESYLYRILNKEGRTCKIGESSQGMRKKERTPLWTEEEVRSLRKETGQAYRSEIRRIFASQREACSYETRIIKRFRKLYGVCALPGNEDHYCSVSHNRKYVPSAVDLVKGRVKNSPELIEQDQIEHLLIQSHFFDIAPFKWVGLMYRYGMKNCLIPHYAPIDRIDGELPIAIELKMEILEWADKNNLRLFYDIHIIGALEALLHVGRQHKLPTHLIEAEPDQYHPIPESLEVCERFYEKPGKALTGNRTLH